MSVSERQMAHLLEEIKKHNFNIALDDFVVEAREQFEQKYMSFGKQEIL